MSEILDRFAARFSPDRVPPGAYFDDNDVLLFVHIPKTAGVSVGASLADVFDTFHSIDWERPRQSFIHRTQQALYLRTQKKQRQVIMGHYRAAEIRYWRDHDLPVKAAAILRDPVARVVSNYNYNISERHPARDRFTERFPTLRDFVLSLPLDVQLNTLLGAFYSFDHALERLMRDFTFLGLTDHLSASLTHLSRSHGLGEMPIHQKNRAPESAPPIDASVRKLILNKSRNDLRLFDLLNSYFQ